MGRLPLTSGTWISEINTFERINYICSVYKMYVVIFQHTSAALTLLTHIPVSQRYRVFLECDASKIFAKQLRSRGSAGDLNKLPRGLL